MSKKEPYENVKKRIDKYRSKPDFLRLEIVGGNTSDKEKFDNLKGLETITNINKLRILMEVWEQNSEEFEDYILKFQYKEQDIANDSFFNTYQIYDKNIISFFLFSRQ